MSANLDRLKAAYKAWHDSKGMSQQSWLDVMSDNVAIRSTGAPVQALAFAGQRHTKQGAVAYMTSLLGTWSMVHWTPETFVESGDRIAVFATCAWTCKATGKTAEVRIAHLWQFQDGKIASLDEIFDTAAAIAAATP